MSIQEDITRIETAKSDIADAIALKGGTVDPNASINTFALGVESIPSGGVPEAPEDGVVYGRQNAKWVEVIEDSFVREYSQFFQNEDVVNGKISISHNLGTENIIVSIYNNTKEQIIPDNISIIDSNNLVLDIISFTPITDSYRLVILGYIKTSSVGDVFKLNYSNLKNLTSSSTQPEINSIFNNYGGLTSFINTISSLSDFIIYLTDENDVYSNDIPVTYQKAKIAPNLLEIVYFDDERGIDVKASFLQNIDTEEYSYSIQNVSIAGAQLIQAEDELDAITKSQSDTENFYYWV